MKKIIIISMLAFMLTGCVGENLWNIVTNKNEDTNNIEEEPDSPLKQPREVEESGLDQSIEEPEYSETITNWYNSTKEEKYIITVLGATYCSYCKEFKPVIEKVSQDKGYNLTWFYIDELPLEDRDAIETLYDLKETGSVPYMFVTYKGELIDYHVGYMEEEDIIKFMKKNKVK